MYLLCIYVLYTNNFVLSGKNRKDSEGFGILEGVVLLTFSKFVNILYKNDDLFSDNKENYVVKLFDIMLGNTDDSVKSENPLAKLGNSSLSKLFNGSSSISQKSAKILSSGKKLQHFASYVSNFSYDNQCAIREEIRLSDSNFDNDDNIGFSCADLFIEIIDEVVTPKANTSTPISQKNAPQIQGFLPNAKTLPVQTISFDPSTNKLSIDDIMIDIPSVLTPPSTIESDEEQYVQALLDAYADAKGSARLKSADIPSLESKYKRNFEEQRVNYYSALRIKQMLRETMETGDLEMRKWLDGTFDYISDTLWDDYDHGYKRLVEVLKKAVDSSTTSVVDRMVHLISAKEKKGACHMLANESRIDWVTEDE